VVQSEGAYVQEFNETMVLAQLAVLNKAVSQVKEFDSHKGSQKSDMHMYEQFMED
jgi:hypothetical protein